MNSRTPLYALVVAIVLAAFLGFTSSDPKNKNLNQKEKTFNNPEFVYGPVLDNPLSTLNESFEGATFPPAGWTKINPDGGTGWNRQTAGTTPIPGWVGGVITAPPGGGTGVAFCTWNTGGATRNDQWLVTPQLTNMQANDSLSFWVRFWPSNIYSDTLDIKISTTTPTTGAFTINVATLIFPRNSTDTNWTKYSYRIGNLFPTGSNIYIAFRERVNDNLNDGASASLDLVSVTSAAGPPPGCNYTWGSQTSGTANALYSVSAVSDQVAWAAGVGPTVIKTTNGGTTWASATGSGIVGDIYNIYAWSANDALCTTSPSATFIYKTTNGGTSWTQVYTLAGGFINAIEMINATTGYAEGDPVGGKWTILQTTDGGSSWARMATEPTQVGTEAGWNNSMKIIGNNIWFGTNNTKVYRSTDLGLTWTGVATTGTLNTYAVHYNSPTTGLAGGNAMVLSTNGGASYSTVTNPGTTGNINGIEGFGTDWWSIRSGNTVYRSTDGAATWTNAHIQTGATFYDIAVVNGANGCRTGWAVGVAGALAKMTGSAVGISGYNSEVPSSYNLKQNYPNPFNPSTNIEFALPQSGNISLKVYDLSGKEVANLVDGFKSAGSYIVSFNASNLPSGAYFYRLTTANFSETKRMMLVK